jgi:hypothetical protein
VWPVPGTGKGEGVFDGLVSDLVMGGDAVSVDGEQDVDAVPRTAAISAGGAPEATHSDSAACRRS